MLLVINTNNDLTWITYLIHQRSSKQTHMYVSSHLSFVTI